MTKAKELFYDAMRIAKEMDNWDNFLVGSKSSLKTLTQAIQIVESNLRLDSLFKNANVDVQERNELNKKILDILKRSREARAKRIKCEKEITKRCTVYTESVKDFDCFALFRKIDEIRRDVEKEFYGK